jgi:hypothetical protein
LYRAETRQTKGLFRLKCVKLTAVGTVVNSALEPE